jgi:hypothetical protein
MNLIQHIRKNGLIWGPAGSAPDQQGGLTVLVTGSISLSLLGKDSSRRQDLRAVLAC